MAIKIQASNNQPSKKKIQIQKCARLMPVIFHNTANDTRFRIYLTSNLLLRDIYHLLLDLSIIIDPPAHFAWKMYSNSSELDYSLTLYENHICKSSEIEVSCVAIPYPTNVETINVKIVKGIGGADCDIDVPMDATVGDVIVGLINEGFLDPDSTSAATVLYNKDADGGISAGVKYDDRSKTVKEYGWKNGQSFVAVCSTAEGGIPVFIPILLPDMRMIEAEIHNLYYEISKEFSFNKTMYCSKSFYYLYDEQNDKMYLDEIDIDLSQFEYITSLPNYGCEGYRLKYALQLKRQIIEELMN